MEWEKERVGFIQKYGQRRRLNAQTESLASRLDLPQFRSRSAILAGERALAPR